MPLHWQFGFPDKSRNRHKTRSAYAVEEFELNIAPAQLGVRPKSIKF